MATNPTPPSQSDQERLRSMAASLRSGYDQAKATLATVTFHGVPSAEEAGWGKLSKDSLRSLRQEFEKLGLAVEAFEGTIQSAIEGRDI